MNLKDTYNKIAADWARTHDVDSWWVEGTDEFASLVKPSADILDIGCGNGVKSEYLTNKGHNITGIDFSEEMVKLAKSRVPTGEFLVRDITQPLDIDKKFDGVFAQAVLLHIPKKEIISVLKNLSTVLKDDGYFYIAVKHQKVDGPEEEVKTDNDIGYEYQRFFSYFTLEEMCGYLEEIGLEVIYKTVAPDVKTSWAQVIAKK